MLENISNEELQKLVGSDKLKIFGTLCEYINNTYEMEKTWNSGGKKWDYEYKFRKSSKTLCAFYFKKDVLGLMIIFGKDERNKVEEIKEEFSKKALDIYDSAKTYHDGKWVMFDMQDISLVEDIKKLLLIKRKPNKK